jgi:glycosyltransferase involved in cell wall biosynthesis
MRLSLVTETYFPQVNGVSRTLDQLVKTVLKHGHTVQILHPRYRKNETILTEGLQTGDFPSFSLPFYKEILLPVVTPGMMRREFEKFDPDVVHVATEGTMGLAALLAARKMGIPVVTSYHTNFPQYLSHYKLGWLEPLSRSYLRWFHNRAGCTLVPTREMMGRLVEKGFREVDEWGRGVDTVQFSPEKRDENLRSSLGIQPGDLAFLYVGRLAPEKNLMTMVNAFLSLNSPASAKLILVGDGPYRSDLEGMTDSRIVLTGYRYGEELAALYASSDVFLFPSLTDTFGNVSQEAMASGLPVVAFDVTGPRSVVRDFVTGILVKEQTEKALASVMKDVLANRDLRLSLSEGALEYARSRDWDHVNSVCLDWYKELYENG